MISAATIIEIVFIAIYALIAPFTIFGAIKHSQGRRTAYVFLNVFVLVRLVGDILLVVAAQDDSVAVKTRTDLYTAGFIMSNIGAGFLISACISFYNNAMGIEKGGIGGMLSSGRNSGNSSLVAGVLSQPSRLLHIINLVATILLIVGMNNSQNVFATASLPADSPQRAHAQLNTMAQVGYVLYLVATVLFILLIAAHHLRKHYGSHHKSDESHLAAKYVMAFLSAALVPILIRVAYSTDRVFAPNYLNYNVYERMVLQYIMEVLAVLIMLALGFVLAAKGLLTAHASTSAQYPLQAYDSEKVSQVSANQV